MITITRSLARQLRSVFRRALHITPRGFAYSIVLDAGPDGLAVRAIADRRQIDLARELNSRFGVSQPDSLSITEASQCIDELKALGNGQGAGRG